MKRLFKFVGSRSAVLSMARGSLKFTPIDELNDPFELTKVIDHAAVRSSLELLRQNGLSEDQFAWLGRQEVVLNLFAPHEKKLNAPRTLAEANHMLSSPLYDDMASMEQRLFSTIESIRNNVGILSLCEGYDSLPMWAYYANQAKGFVVVLEDLDRCFRGDKTGSLNEPKRVDYVERFIGMTFDPSTQDRLFFSKLSDWSHEREWRVVTALNACSFCGGLYSRNVDPLHVTGVICGWRVGADDASSLRDDLMRENPKASFRSTILDGRKVNLDPPLQ
jgi:hypothetical protein